MTRKITRDPNRAPTHPGAVLRHDVFPAVSKSIATIADHLGVTRQHLHRILSEKAPVTPDMALRLGKFCGNGPELWLALQQDYDLWHTRREIGATLKKIPTVKTAA